MAITTTTVLPLDQAAACARQAIEFLLSHSIPPAPVNFAVAYEFHSGTKGELHKILDAYLKGGKSLDELLLRDLYDRYVASDRVRQFQGMRNDFHGILQSLMQTIGSAGNNADIYRQRLEDGIAKLDGGESAVALQAVAGDLMMATVAAKQDNETLRSSLESAQQEAEQLREALEQHRREALIDPLTGLFNRRALDQHLDSVWLESNDTPMSLLVLDIDHFKRVNDNYGHAVGDVVIRHVADTMRKCIRGEDVAVRYGGEEFMVLLPGTPLDGALKVAETIRTRIAALRLTRKHDNLTLDPFTISLGVALRRQDDSYETLFERADQALYQSKSNGRNRVTAAEVIH